MEADDQQIARFMEATHTSFEQAQFFLEAAGGNYERGVSMFYEQSGGGHPADVPPRPPAPTGGLAADHFPGVNAVNAYPAAARGPLPPPLQLLGVVLGAPFAVLGGGIRLLRRTLGFGAAVAGAVASRVLPARLSAVLGRAGRAVSAAGRDLPPAAAAAEFAQQFTERYGGEGPQWQECGWGEAASRAHGLGKFLFAYLHSPGHQDTDAYCRDTLTSPALVPFLDEHFLCWGGDLRRSDAFRLASNLRAARYPYVALLAFSGTRTRLITAVEGKLPPTRLQEVLQAALNDHGSLLWQEHAERQQRETDRLLRQEQDSEYERSLAADQQREAARAAAQAEAEAAARAAEEEAVRARAEAEAAEQQRAAAEEALRRRKSEKRAVLGEEPPAGTPETTLIRVRLPDGATHQRRFWMADSLQVVYDFVDSRDGVTALRYSLATTFPRRVYRQESLGVSLRELDLAPQAHRHPVTMSGKEALGMATKGMAEGPEIKDKSQVDQGQPGLQKDMKDQPVSEQLPTQHGDEEVLTLESYRGVGKFKGKVALITGGDSGIGRSVAVLMAKEGAKGVAIVYLPAEQPDAKDAQKLIEAEGSEALLLPMDLSEGDAVCKKIVDKVVEKYGRVDVLVNNAAVQYVVPSITETGPEIVEDTFRTNVFPMIYLSKYCVPHMRRGSSIINSTSVTAYNGSPSLLEYSCTKGAIVSFTRSLALQLADKGIRVNAVASGPPVESATSYVFLASQEAAFMTAQFSAGDSRLAPLPSANLAAPGSAVEPPETRYLLRSEHPQVAVTWSTALISDRPKPDTLKLRKRVHAWPLEFTFRADYHTETRVFDYGLTCRDQLLKGDITLNVPQQQVQYLKRLPLAGGATLAVNASCRLQDKRLVPDAGITVEFGTQHSSGGGGTGSAVYVSDAHGGSSFDVQQRFKVAKGLALEVCGNVRLPSPAARYSPEAGQLVLGEGAFHIHVAQVNAVVHI
ncbi:putative oxidoreductase YhdF [Chlorella vulgaris]